MTRARAAKRETAREPSVVVTLLTADGDARLLSNPAHDAATLVECTNLADAATELARSAPTVFVCRRSVENARALDRLVRDALAADPHLAVIVVAPGASGIPTDARALRQLGVAHVVHSGTDAARRIRSCVAAALDAARFRAERVHAAAVCAAAAPWTARAAVRYAVEHGDRPLAVRQLADGIGIPRKTLDRRLCRTCAVTARQLIGWGRLMSAAIRLDTPGMTVGAVARDLTFSSPSALRNLLQRYTGLTPTQIREVGGADYLMDRLTAALRASFDG